MITFITVVLVAITFEYSNGFHGAALATARGNRSVLKWSSGL
jgi:hypothetical protein